MYFTYLRYSLPLLACQLQLLTPIFPITLLLPNTFLVLHKPPCRQSNRVNYLRAHLREAYKLLQPQTIHQHQHCSLHLCCHCNCVWKFTLLHNP